MLTRVLFPKEIHDWSDSKNSSCTRFQASVELVRVRTLTHKPRLAT